jgi:hypothetical protein
MNNFDFLKGSPCRPFKLPKAPARSIAAGLDLFVIIKALRLLTPFKLGAHCTHLHVRKRKDEKKLLHAKLLRPYGFFSQALRKLCQMFPLFVLALASLHSAREPWTNLGVFSRRQLEKLPPIPPRG